jgi:hypothetical protein
MYNLHMPHSSYVPQCVNFPGLSLDSESTLSKIMRIIMGR